MCWPAGQSAQDTPHRGHRQGGLPGRIADGVRVQDNMDEYTARCTMVTFLE